MAFRLSCPSCNTSFALGELPADRRAECPRCHDVFPVKSWEETVANPTLAPSLSTQHSALSTPRRALLITLGMGLLGLTIGLVVYFNRGGLRGKPGPEPVPTAAVTPATQLIGIGYLPADTSVAFAVQPGPILAYAERMKQDPRALLTSAGIPAAAFDTLTQLGLSLPQIDHVAFGWPGELRFTLVLVLRTPLADEDAFLRKLKATKPASGKGPSDIELPGLPVPAHLARVSPTVWVLGVGFDAAKGFEAAERGGYGPGGKQFAPGLTEMLGQRVPPEAAAWIATGDERWDEKPAVRLLLEATGKKQWLPVLARGRAGMLALNFDDPPRARLFLKAVDEATGQQVRDYFKAQAAANDKVQHGGSNEYAFLDMPLDPATAAATLERFVTDAAQK
jgi:hypothetical protein